MARCALLALLLAAVFPFATPSSHCEFPAVDRTLEPEAKGEDVVLATVDKIIASGVFSDDFGFLRRMAAVETSDGEGLIAGTGGIWGISPIEFLLVDNFMENDRRGQNLEDQFVDRLCFSWSTTVTGYSELDVPLYSALAVMIRLVSLGRTITDDDIEAQAILWRDSFTFSGDLQTFIDTAEALLENDISHCDNATIDITLMPRAVGMDVVLATVDKIQESGIFPDDLGFLRRMAAVETNDGERATNGSGGIWDVLTVEILAVDILMNSDPRGQDLDAKFKDTFCLCWSTAVTGLSAMDVPLYSALVVMIRLVSLGRTIPDNIEAQAILWRDSFTVGGDPAEFIATAETLLGNNISISHHDNNTSDMTSGIVGRDVVLATVNTIRESGIFPDDFGFLRRMAAVETSDGEGLIAGSGGIWGISPIEFLIVDNFMKNDPRGQKLEDQFVDRLGFSWSTTVIGYSELDVPLYSALAVMIRLVSLGRTTILDDIEAQATLWRDSFTVGGDVQTFIDVAEELLNLVQECDNSRVDMIFVMDESSRIGASNFELLKQFAINITDEFEIGPDRTQVGWINFNSRARVAFNLSSYQDKVSLHNAIRAVSYSGGGTNISEGLLALYNYGFVESAGARNNFTIPEVAIVVVGSQSSIGPVISAAQILRENINVNVFVVGVGSTVSTPLLNAVASAGIVTDSLNYVYSLSNFTAENFQLTLRETIRARTCFDAMFTDHKTSIQRILGSGQTIPMATIHFNLECPPEGLIINACGREGVTILFISTNPSPNSANYDRVITIAAGRCLNTFIDCSSRRRRRQIQNTAEKTYDIDNKTVRLLHLMCSLGPELKVECSSSNQLATNKTVCTFNRATANPCILPYEIDVKGLPVGTHTVHVTATDVFGQTAETTLDYIVVKDRVGDDMVFSTVLDMRFIKLNVSEPTVSLCYQVHGQEEHFYNLISDYCVSVNAHVSQPKTEIDSHVIDKIGIRAIGSNGTCYNIAIIRENCAVSINNQSLEINSKFEEESVIVHNDRTIARNPNVIHVSVPNCGRPLVNTMHIMCTHYHIRHSATPTEVLEFTTIRGLSPIDAAHGLLGQFWGRFMLGRPLSSVQGQNDKEMTIFHQSLLKRFNGFVHGSWSSHGEMCFYAGDRQGGPVILGQYEDYEVETLLSTEYIFSKFEEFTT